MEKKIIVKPPLMIEGAAVAECLSACLEVCRLQRHGGLEVNGLSDEQKNIAKQLMESYFLSQVGGNMMQNRAV